MADLPLTTIAQAMGGNARAGFEDTLQYTKVVLADNPPLIPSRAPS